MIMIKRKHLAIIFFTVPYITWIINSFIDAIDLRDINVLFTIILMFICFGLFFDTDTLRKLNKGK